MSQLAFTRKMNTRRWTQFTRSSILTSRRGISRPISSSSACRPNSIVASTRESVLNGGTASGANGGFSLADTVERRESD
jgi:hypothetical protein